MNSKFGGCGKKLSRPKYPLCISALGVCLFMTFRHRSEVAIQQGRTRAFIKGWRVLPAPVRVQKKDGAPPPLKTPF